MHLHIKKGDGWDKTRVVFEKDGRKDYDHAESDGVELFLYGYPYHKRDKTWLSARELCRHYLENELGFVDETEGVYAIVVLDRIKERCLVIVDRYGIYNLFHARSLEEFLISDSVGELLTLLPKVSIDRRSVVEFLNIGHLLGSKTLVDGVSKFKPATVNSVDSNLDMSEKSYWRFVKEDNQMPPSSLSKEERLEQILALFNENVMTAFELEERVSLPLSSGVDSRAMLSACLPWKERLHCYTHGQEHCLDVGTAERLSTMFGVSHDAYVLNREWISTIPELADRNTEMMDGLVNSVLFAHVRNSFDRESGKGDLLMTSPGGEMFKCYWVNPDLPGSTTLEAVAASLRKRVQLRAPFDVYSDLSPEEAVKLLEASVLEDIQPVRTANPVTIAEYLYLAANIGNFFSPPITMAGRNFKIFTPYLDPRILESVPFFDLDEKRANAIQRYIIARNSPAQADIPTDHEQLAAMAKSAPRKMLYARAAANKIAKKLFGKALFPTSPKTRALGLKKYRISAFDSWLPEYHAQYVLATIDHDRMILKDFFRKDKLDSAVNSFMRGEESMYYYFLTNIMSVELWLRRMGALTDIETK